MKTDTLLCADLHVKRRPDEQFALTQVVDAAIARKVKRVVAAGDLLDRQTNRAEPVAFFYRQLDRLEEAGIEFFFLEGQHDADFPPWLSGHRHAVHAHKEVFEVGGMNAYGLDWQPFGRLQEELAEMPDHCPMLLAHQGWGDWVGDAYQPQGDFAQVPGHVTHVFSGDLHQWKLDRNKNADGAKMICCSPGASCMQKVDEPAEHFYALLGEDCVFRPQKLKSRVFIDCPLLLTPADLDRFVGEIEGELAVAYQRAAGADYPPDMMRPYLRVTYSHRLEDCVRRVAKVVGDRAILYWKETPPESKQPGKVVARPGKEQAVTPLSVLGDEVDKDEEPELFGLCSMLIEAPDHEQAFASWWLEATGEK